jgi:hypothetical protein
MTDRLGSQKVVAKLSKSPRLGPGHDGLRPAVQGPRPSLRRLTGRVAICAGSAAEGLFVPTGAYDKHGLAVRLNWRHPLALPACCALVIAIPCLVILAGYVWIGRRRDRLSAQRHNAYMRGWPK